MSACLLQAASLVHYDETPIAQTSVEQLDLNSFGEYFQRIYEQPFEEADIPLVSTLSNMRFMVMDQRGNLRLSLAGLLLFVKRPQDFLYHTYIN